MSESFSESPLRYVADEAGYTVYSLRKDGQDDGGDSEFDLVYTIALSS